MLESREKAMAKILIVNAGIPFGHSGGKLNRLLTDVAHEALQAMGHEIQVVHLEQEYDTAAELKKYLWADVVIYQQPGWWMGAPWVLKKYLDDVLTAGHGTLYASDGRTRSDNSQKYGSGGLAHGKRYMISSTWNAPLEAFTDPDQFFEGKGAEAVYFPFHKAHQFLGMSALPDFMCNNVIKDPDIEQDVVRYKAHLAEHFKAL